MMAGGKLPDPENSEIRTAIEKTYVRAYSAFPHSFISIFMAQLSSKEFKVLYFNPLKLSF